MAENEKSWDLNGLIKAYEADSGSTLTRTQVGRYLKEGILTQPDEGAAFGEHHLERLRMIEHLRSRYGMSLRDISGLFGVIVNSRPTPPGGEPEPVKQIADRRERIISNATELFAAKGYHGTTIDEIVQATGIAKGTFYVYFESKEEILVEVIKRLIGETMEKIDDTLARKGKLDFVTRIEIKGQELLDLYLKRSELIYMLLGETVGNQRLMEQLKDVYEKLAERIEEDIREGVESGEIFPFKDLKTISYALVGMGQSIAVLLSGSTDGQREKTWKTLHEFITRSFAV